MIFAIAPPARRERSSIAISSKTVEALQAAEAQRLGLPSLTEEQGREVESRAIEDELLYREALRLALDRADPIVRQRLVQKQLLLAEDLGGASRAPTPAELQSYFERTRERWKRPSRLHFVHVFATRAESLPSRAALPETGVPALGEPFPYSREMTADRAHVARTFGARFADAVSSLEIGAWSEPVSSNFGWHRVRVVEHVGGGPAELDEVRKDVELDFALVRREEVVAEYLKRLAATYGIERDGKPVRDFVPTRRVASRTDSSAED